MLDRFQLIEKRERIRPMNLDIRRTRALLILFATAVVVAALVALVNANPAWTADPSFEPAPNSPVPVGSTPTTVTNADFNADGKMDLAAQNAGSNNVSVRLGNGDGTFQAKPDVAVGSGPTSVISADFNSDGIADLAVANQNSGNVSILLGQDSNSDGKGEGTFQPKKDYGVGPLPSSVISADFNTDGITDLALATRATSEESNVGKSDQVSVLLGQDSNGDGKGDGFRTAQRFSIAADCTSLPCLVPPMALPNQIIAADFNGDNKADLATANVGIRDPIFGTFNNPGGVSVLLGKGDGTFQAPKEVMKVSPDEVFSITAANLDAGSSMDLVATKFNSNVISVLKGNGDGTFQAPQSLPVGVNPSAVTSADLDGDTKVDDLAVSNNGSNNVSVLFNHDSGGFQAARNFPAGNGPVFVIGADFNADSFADLAVANQNSNNVSVLLNTPGQDTTAPITTRSLSPQPNPTGWNKEDVTVTLNATDNDSGVKEISYSINGGQSITVEQSSVQIPPITNEGETTISYFATDNAGNVEEEQTFKVKLDKSAPDASIISGPSGPTNDATPTFSFDGLDNLTTATDLLFSYKVVAEGVAPESVNWSEYSSNKNPTLGGATGLAQGSYTFYVKAKDQAGNEDASPTQRSFTVDTTAPAAPTINSPANNSFDTDGTITISGTAVANSTVEVFEATTSGDISKGTTPVDASGAWIKTLSGVSDGSHTYKGKAKDAAGNVSGPSDPRTVKVDTAAPTASAPKHSFTTLSTLGTTTVPVKLTWSATDNPGGSGIASYQLQQSVSSINGGAYTNVTLPSATATTISRSLAPGTNTYRYRVAAKDNAGNLSAWATGPSFKVTAYQESSSAVVDTGSWTTSALSGAYGGSVQYASALGRNATFSVPVGTKNVEWVSNRGPNRGKAQVWLDGVQQDANPGVTGIQPFDLYSSTAQARKVVFSKAVSATTSHNLQVRVLGQKNASSTSTRVDIDAFVRTS
jgi:hypothetical protein